MKKVDLSVIVMLGWVRVGLNTVSDYLRPHKSQGRQHQNFTSMSSTMLCNLCGNNFHTVACDERYKVACLSSFPSDQLCMLRDAKMMTDVSWVCLFCFFF